MLLSVNDLHVYYGAIHAVKGVSLEVNEGEIVTLIGANGAGKSTVLNTISGLLRAKTGTIEFMGTPINTMAPNKIVQLGLAPFAPISVTISPSLTSRETPLTA